MLRVGASRWLFTSRITQEYTTLSHYLSTGYTLIVQPKGVYILGPSGMPHALFVKFHTLYNTVVGSCLPDNYFLKTLRNYLSAGNYCFENLRN